MLEKVKGRIALVGAVLSVMLLGAVALAGPSSAAPADPVDGAFDDLQDKVATYGAATVALVIAVVLIFFGLKFLKRGASKA